MHNFVIAKAAKMTILQDQWLLQREKPTAETKTYIKKAIEVEKKKKEKLNKAKGEN